MAKILKGHNIAKVFESEMGTLASKQKQTATNSTKYLEKLISS